MTHPANELDDLVHQRVRLGILAIAHEAHAQVKEALAKGAAAAAFLPAYGTGPIRGRFLCSSEPREALFTAMGACYCPFRAVCENVGPGGRAGTSPKRSPA